MRVLSLWLIFNLQPSIYRITVGVVYISLLLSVMVTVGIVTKAAFLSSSRLSENTLPFGLGNHSKDFKLSV